MCLAIPGKVEKILDNNYALVDFSGIKKEVCIDFLRDVKVGDYVNVHVGFAINKIDEKQAKENLRYINEAYSG
ncbi:MAG: HypC/HybG/HupF family hydrogenase formation chaperone [Candidatus Omnitrophica bacterium]|nr:HypC/HybG/HupF family hydrogenase formation chaperone [Candidatus Omnitrophota bacterium]MDD5352494.1 HypC/HybG/HupF family hydrogenase formation chaperone [Candidatus Omnitrophota bacterium]MDD5550092.1 HypC/HybG/HupF family hydrogenase formation chaperone [Candidatus Omnitrophota bacterium]